LESLGVFPNHFAELSKSIDIVQKNQTVDYESLFIPPNYMTPKMFNDNMLALQTKLEILSNGVSVEEVNASFCENQLAQLKNKPSFFRSMTRGCPNYRELMLESLKKSDKKATEYAKEMAEITFQQVKLHEYKPFDGPRFYQEVIPLVEELQQLGKHRQDAINKMHKRASLKALSAKLRK